MSSSSSVSSESIAEELDESIEVESSEDKAEEEEYEEDYEEDYEEEELPPLPPPPPSSSSSYGIGYQHAAIDLDDLDVPPPPSSAAPSALSEKKTKKEGSRLLKVSFEEEKDNDYSLSFEDDSDQYSQDFDVSTSKDQKIIMKPSPSSLPSSPSPLFPSLTMQSLEAERAMEKLSKEIVFLRNQQRTALKQRRIEAREKKMRAEERRRKHQEELLEAKQQVEKIMTEKKTLEDTVASLNLTILGLEESKSLLSSSLDRNKNVIKEQEEAINKLEAELSSQKDHVVKREAEFKQKEEKLYEDIESLRKAVTKSELQISIISKSNEAAEERLARDRANLPAHHQDILDERLRHLKGLEESVRRREEAIKCDEESSRLSIEKARQDLRAEIDRREVRLVAEVEEQRAAVVKKEEALAHEKKSFQIQISEENARVENRQMALNRQENALLEKEKELEQQLTEFRIAKQAVEPELAASRQDREEARAMQQNAQRAEERTKELERRARFKLDELEQREEAVDQAWLELNKERRRVLEAQTSSRAATRACRRDRGLLESEREKLHRIGAVLTNQFRLLQQASLEMQRGHASVALFGNRAPPDLIAQSLNCIQQQHWKLQDAPQYSEVMTQIDQAESEAESHHDAHSREEVSICISNGQEEGVPPKSPPKYLDDAPLKSSPKHLAESFPNPRLVLRAASQEKKSPPEDSLDYSALSQTPPVLEKSESFQSHRASKENIRPGSSMEFDFKLSSSWERPARSVHEPSDFTGGVKVSTEALKSAAMRYGVLLEDSSH